jgi:hypothetical protein
MYFKLHAYATQAENEAPMYLSVSLLSEEREGNYIAGGGAKVLPNGGRKGKKV